ncbi:hypothetical protein RIF29_25288 [Crotalaria pallida]|uniref:Uncharacterized protein n=1 Tax=Crotalaria pallida TaxID=3830 RepID=A0AAN9I0Y6_CROPI
MRQKKNKTKVDVRCNSQTGSKLNDEGNGEGAGEVLLKKGPWTSDEDAMLVEYIKKHGEGNWGEVQRHSGLYRCGKSCRLRWANNLRPNLKKGAFTAEEERLIVELHAKMGNRWAHIVTHLPGRTDNEIKNYWNTRIRKCQRYGLPLYPPDVCLQALQESQHGQGSNGITDCDRGHNDFLLQNIYGIHDTAFDSMKENMGFLPYVPELPDISSDIILLKGYSTQYCNFLSSTFPYLNHLQESTMSYIGSRGMDRNDCYLFDHNTSEKIPQSFGVHSPLDPGPSTHSSIRHSHSLPNSNVSSSKPNSKAGKLELPSLQYPETVSGFWGTSPPTPLYESDDAFIQCPPSPTALESICSSPHKSGLLDALLYQAKTLNCSKSHCSDKSSNSSTATPSDRAESSVLNMFETEWEDYADPLSPFGAASILNEHQAISTNGNSWDQLEPVQTSCDVENFLFENSAGNIVKLESVNQVLTHKGENQTMSEAELNCTWSDFLHASDWHDHCSGHSKNQAMMTDSSDDLAENKHMAGGASTSSQVQAVGSITWNNLPPIYQMSDLH